MVKFISMVGIVVVLVALASLLWPRISPNPRPQPLARVHEILMNTPAGQNAANILGVSDESQIIPLTPQLISQQIVGSIKARVSDVIITNAVREITKRFKDLPAEEQSKVIEAFTQSISTSEEIPTSSPTENLPDPSQNSTN